MAIELEVREREIKTIAKNRKAYHDFFVIHTYEAGIILQGTEVKSLRLGQCSLQDAYAGFPEHESYDLYLINFHITPYEHGNINNHEPKRRRKLLVNHREAVKLKNSVAEKGLTIIPLSVYFSGRFVKVELGVVRAKKKYDKREDNKKKDAEREIRKKFKY